MAKQLKEQKAKTYYRSAESGKFVDKKFADTNKGYHN